MLQKSKIMILALAAVVIIVLFLNIQTFSAQKKAERERDEARNNYSSLQKDFGALKENFRSLDDKKRAVEADLAKLKDEKDELQKKFDTVSQEREKLVAELQAKTQSAAAAMQAATEEAKKPAVPSVNSSGEDTYWAGILKAKTELEVQLNNARAELKNMQINNEQLNREKSGLELDIKNFTRQGDELKQQSDYYQKLMDSLSQELVRERNNKIQIENNSKAIKNENYTLRRQLRGLSERKIDLERKLADLQVKSRSLEDNYNKLQSLLKDKLNQIDELSKQADFGRKGKLAEEESKPVSESVELPPIVVHPQQQGSASEGNSQKGEVLLVNKENNFVVVNLGDNSGLKVGDILQVTREDKSIASVEVIQIRRNFSA
ncbi:MAG: hypothetical protein PHN57_02545 [Candidatus Omnitrophica bacterium]|nr:hypothetical protein [Candidatus Omnitrophota bacterium]